VTITYKGFHIFAARLPSLGGAELLFFNIIREADGWVMVDSFTDGAYAVQVYMAGLMQRVDAYLEDPIGECAEHGADETCAACEIVLEASA
jgi:hypothetical protein